MATRSSAIVRTLTAAGTAACLAVATLGGSAVAADPPPPPVPVMPGTSTPTQVEITDDGVYTSSIENGQAVYRRTLTRTASGTTLGPATFVGHSASDGNIAVSDDTLAFARRVDGRLVLQAPDGSETVPAWDDGWTFYRGMHSYTGGWISSHLIGMAYVLHNAATGTPVDLLAMTPALPAGTTFYLRFQHTDDRVLWGVTGFDDDADGVYTGLYTSALDADGPTGPVDTLVQATCSPSCTSAMPLAVVGDMVVWVGGHSDTSLTVHWFAGPPYTGTAQQVTVPSTAAGQEWMTGTELVTGTSTPVGTNLTWYDLASATPDVAVRTMAVPGWVQAVHGSLVAYRTDAGAALLVDADGLPITADPTPAVTPGFSDVSSAEPAWSPAPGFSAEIMWLADHGIVGGYPDGTFRGLASVNRDAMAAFLYRAAHDGARAPACTAAAFTDVPASHPFCGEIAWLASTGIANGWPDGTFRPGAPVTREAMAAFLYRFANDGADAPACEAAPFSDVVVGQQFCGEVAWLAEAGVTAGWPDGTFRPALSIERQAMAAFLFRFIDAGLVPTS